MRVLESANTDEAGVCMPFALLPIAATGWEDTGRSSADKVRVRRSGKDFDSAQIMAVRNGGGHSRAGTRRARI
jgi:hypothetical protein